MNREEMLKKAYDLGFAYERDFGGCGQCVIAAIQDTLGKRNVAVFKAGTALAGGVAISSVGTCGAVVGSVMMLSSLLGRERNNFNDPKGGLKAFALAKELCKRFFAEYGGINCPDVQKKLYGKSFKLSEPGVFKAFLEAGGHTFGCTSVCGNAAKWTIELLLDQK